MSVENKIKQLKEKYLEEGTDDAKQTISTWEKSLHKAIATKNFGDHFVIKGIREELNKRLNGLNEILQTDENLKVEGRDKIFAKKEVYQWFLNLFSKAGDRVKAIEAVVDYQLK